LLAHSDITGESFVGWRSDGNFTPRLGDVHWFDGRDMRDPEKLAEIETVVYSICEI